MSEHTARTKPDAKLKTKPIEPVAALGLIDSERWTSKIRVDAATGCHVWTASKVTSGYGHIRLAGRIFYAHRVAYVAKTGADVVPGLTIDHLCRNRACVNADHLEAVTHRVNVLRGGSPSAAHAVKTHCPAGHELTDKNLTKVGLRRGSRKCLTCSRERSREQAAAIREAHTRLGLTRREYVAAYGKAKKTALSITASLDWAALVSTRNHQSTERTNRDCSIV